MVVVGGGLGVEGEEAVGGGGEGDNVVAEGCGADVGEVVVGVEQSGGDAAHGFFSCKF